MEPIGGDEGEIGSGTPRDRGDVEEVGRSPVVFTHVVASGGDGESRAWSGVSRHRLPINGSGREPPGQPTMSRCAVNPASADAANVRVTDHFSRNTA